jgi:hypothetical protein
MTRISDLHERWMQDEEYRREYDALDGELGRTCALNRERADDGLTGNDSPITRKMSMRRDYRRNR